MGKKQWLGALLLALAAVAVLLIGGNYYISSMQDSLWMQSVSDVLEVTAQGSHAFEVFVEKDMELLSGLGNNLSQYDSDDSGAILDKLVMYGEEGANFTVIDLKRGISYTNIPLGSTEVSEERLAEYAGLGERGTLEPYLDDFTGQRMVGYYERFSFLDGTDGIVLRGQLTSDIAGEFSLSFYNDTGFSYIVNSAGDILVRSRHRNSNWTFLNVFDVIELEGNSEEDVQNFRDGMADGKRGAMQFLFDEEEYIFAFVPVAGTDGWYVISIVPDSVIMEYADEILRTSQSFLLIVLISAAVLIAFALLIWQYRRNMRAKDAEVKYREQLFGILANSTDDVFVMLDSGDLAVEYISPNVERVLGIPREEVMGGIASLGGADYAGGEEVGHETLEAIGPDCPAVFETERVQRMTGEHRWFVETVYRKLVDSSERFIVTIADRTADRQSEYALKEALKLAETANTAKSTFLSNMSHDIRTPMNAIIGLATLLQRDADSPERVKDHTRKIVASSQHLLGLINDVLDMSKIESGKTTLNVGEITLAEIVDELGTIMRPQAKAKRQEFEIFVYDVKEERLLGDKLRINQILINILSNAVKYTQEGGRIVMEVRELTQVTKNFARLRFAVEDNGMGMSEEYLETIFQPFSREANSEASGIQGTGLGMAITKNLVDMMGGTIAVESKPGEGSRFTVELELRIQEEDIDQDFWVKYGVTEILVVDDEEDVCASILRAMEGTGVAMQYVLDGPSAIRSVRDAHGRGRDFDMVLLDWKMPGMDGIETARHIREILPADVPIMILTAYDWDEIEEEGLAAGISGFMSKPFFLSNFKETIRSLKDAERKAGPEESHGDILKGRHFLAAEDNELNAEILAELLGMSGATCEIAVNGQEAVEAFELSEPGHFDAILMDVQMPVMDGYDAARAIRAGSHPLAAAIPIVAMTANAFADDISDALAAGMDAHVSKPVDMERLKEVLEGIFAKPGRDCRAGAECGGGSI